MSTKRLTVADIDAESWRRNPFVTAAPEYHSVVSAGSYLRILKVPVTDDRRVCLARHQLYSADKYQVAFSSRDFLAALEAPGAATLEDGVLFTGARSHWHFLIDGLGIFHTLEGCEGKTLYVDAELSNEQVGFLLGFAKAAGFGAFRATQRLSTPFYRFANCTFYCRRRFTQKVQWIRAVLGLDPPPGPEGASVCSSSAMGR